MNTIYRSFAGFLTVTLSVFSLIFSLPSKAASFDQIFELQGITFHVTCPNQGSLNELVIAPGGLEIDNSVITREIDGLVTGAEIADMNGDGSPEIYIYVHSAGSGSYGDLIAYSANNKKSLSAIYLPPLEEQASNLSGYMGHDEFAVVEGRLLRRFPVYVEGDTNANPTGGIRQIQYKLTSGEASWSLKLESNSSINILEIRAVEEQPSAGLTKMTLQGSDREMYVANASVLSDEDVESALLIPVDNGPYQIKILLTEAGGNKLEAATADSGGKPLAVIVNGKLVSVPIVREKITNRQIIVSGNFAENEARQIVDELNRRNEF